MTLQILLCEQAHACWITHNTCVSIIHKGKHSTNTLQTEIDITTYNALAITYVICHSLYLFSLPQHIGSLNLDPIANYK